MISSCLLFRLSFATLLALVASIPSRSSKSVCYGDLGCFEPRSGSKNLPESPEKINTRFFLYTRNHPDLPGESISAVHLGRFNFSKETKVIIHGFTDRSTNKWVLDMKNELLKAGDFNVVAVDWSGSGNTPTNYDAAAANTVIVATVTHQLLTTMIHVGATSQRIHLIGHSLGAHVSGYIGRDLPNIARISGLDPAGPNFYVSDTRDRLDPTDATFVDVIHSNAAMKVVDGFGHLDPLGHVDFYPNGGWSQPSCASHAVNVLAQTVLSLISTFNVDNAMDVMACNHMAAVYYYTSSINPQRVLNTYPCADYRSFDHGFCTSCSVNGVPCQRLGYGASPTHVLGSLSLTTLSGLSTYNFGQQIIVKLESDSNNEDQTRGIIQVNFNELEARTVLKQDTLITRGSVISKAIAIGSYPQSLTEISVSFVKSIKINLGIGLAGKWSFSALTVFDLQSSISYKFCPTPPAPSLIQSGSRLTFRLC